MKTVPTGRKFKSVYRGNRVYVCSCGWSRRNRSVSWYGYYIIGVHLNFLREGRGSNYYMILLLTYVCLVWVRKISVFVVPSYYNWQIIHFNTLIHSTHFKTEFFVFGGRGYLETTACLYIYIYIRLNQKYF